MSGLSRAPKPPITAIMSVRSRVSKRPETAIGNPEVVTAGEPSAETVRQSKAVRPMIRLAARKGSMAEAAHISEDPDSTRKVTFSGVCSL